MQPSNRRAYSMREYEKEGAVITDDICGADTILGRGVFGWEGSGVWREKEVGEG